MKATLEFNLPEDQEEFQTAQDGGKAKGVLHELDQHLRSKTKYAPDTQSEQVTETYQEIREKLWELASQESLEF